MVFLVASLIAGTAFADSYVKGHTRKDGTYVQGHTRSSPDQYRNNNRGSESRGGNQRDEYSHVGRNKAFRALARISVTGKYPHCLPETTISGFPKACLCDHARKSGVVCNDLSGVSQHSSAIRQTLHLRDTLPRYESRKPKARNLRQKPVVLPSY